MNKPLLVAVALFMGTAMFSLVTPASEAQAGWRRHSCCGTTRSRCHGRHRHRAHRCGGCSGYQAYDCQTAQVYSHGCHGGHYSEDYGAMNGSIDDAGPPAPPDEPLESTDRSNSGEGSPSDANAAPPTPSPDDTGA